MAKRIIEGKKTYIIHHENGTKTYIRKNSPALGIPTPGKIAKVFLGTLMGGLFIANELRKRK